MKARFLWITVIVLILLSLPALVLAQPPITPSAGPSGDGVEGAPLGSPDALWDQPSDGYSGISDQCFTDYGFCVYSADDFSLAAPWNIELIFVDGQSGQLPQADNLHWLVYPDAGGEPAGRPDVGGEMWSYSCKPSDPEVTISGSGTQATLDIVEAQGAPLHLPPGTYWLCFYPTMDVSVGGQWFWDTAGTTNLAPAQWLDPTDYFGIGGTSWIPWYDVVGGSYDAAFRLEGSIAPPVTSNLKYLHSTGGLFDLTDPLDTQWHELWPVFCREYHLSSWEDNGDGILSYCDSIDMYEKPDGELRPYHVENVTITLLVTPVENHATNYTNFTSPPPLQGAPKPMYIELKGGYNETALMNPVGTLWHEIYPNFCTQYELIDWEGIAPIDFCDEILLENKRTEEVTWWHVEEVAIDIVVTAEPPPVGGEAYPVSKASLLAPWIALGVLLAGGISWYVLRRRRAQS